MDWGSFAGGVMAAGFLIGLVSLMIGRQRRVPEHIRKHVDDAVSRAFWKRMSDEQIAWIDRKHDLRGEDLEWRKQLYDAIGLEEVVESRKIVKRPR